MPDICNERDFRLAVAALKRGIVSVEDCLSAFHTQANVSTQSLAEHLISNRLITPEILDELSHSLEPNTQSDPVLSQFDAIGRPAAEKELRFDLADSLASDHDQSTIDYRTRDVSPRYTVRRHLADGGLGRVLVAWDRDLHREVAVKEMKSCSPDTLRRFLLEAKVTGQLEHPNIVPVYELVQSPNDEYKPFYAMRLIHGRTLEAEIRQRHSEKTIYRDPIILNRLLQAFLGVCNAIEFAHHRNIIHRDIKPRNIVLGGFGEVIVLDWGLVKTLGEQQGSTVPISDQSDSGAPESTVDGQILGTIAYAAPEQVTGLVSQIDQRTDVFALGATLFAILTGHPPFGRHVGSQVESSASEPAPPRVSNFETRSPKPLAAICQKAMSKAKEDRYANVQLLAADIQRFLADEPVSVYQDSIVSRSLRWCRRHRSFVGPFAAAVLAVVSISTIAAFLLWQANGRVLRAQRNQMMAQIKTLQTAKPSEVVAILRYLSGGPRESTEVLAEIEKSTDLTENQRNRVRLALLPSQPQQAERLADHLLKVDLGECLLLRESLVPFADRLTDRFWKAASENNPNSASWLNALSTLAVFAPKDARWKTFETPLAQHLVSAEPSNFEPLLDCFRPIGPQLKVPLAQEFRTEKRPEYRQAAAYFQSEFAKDDSKFLIDLALDADTEQFRRLWPVIQQDKPAAISILEAKLKLLESARSTESNSRNAVAARRQAIAATLLVLLGEPFHCWPLLRHSPDPCVRTRIIHILGPLGVDPAVLFERLEHEPDVSARRALILSFGQYSPGSNLSPTVRNKILVRTRDLFESDPDAGIHAATKWLLSLWASPAEIRKLEAKLQSRDPIKGRDWFINQHGITFNIIRGPVRYMIRRIAS